MKKKEPLPGNRPKSACCRVRRVSNSETDEPRNVVLVVDYIATLDCSGTRSSACSHLLLRVSLSRKETLTDMKQLNKSPPGS